MRYSRKETAMNKITLKQGINLYLIPDKKFKTYFAGIYLHAPLNENTVTENALLPLLLKRGSKTYPTKAAISEKLDMLMGASFSSHARKSGEIQTLSFSISGVSDAFSPFDHCFRDGLSLLSDIVFNPLIPFSEEFLESEKLHLSELIESEKNDKRAYASLRCRQEMNKGTAYAVPEHGYAKKLPSITKESLKSRYDSLISSCPLDIIVSGNFNEADAIKFFDSLKDSLKERDASLPLTKLSVEGELSTVTETMDISQGKLCIGFCAPDKEEYAKMTVYNSVFGGGAHSKLFNNVREKLSLAYYAGSTYDPLKGIILVSSGIETGNFEKARDEILLQHKAMTLGEISQNELAVAKKSIINSLVSMGDSVTGLASLKLSRILRDDTTETKDLIEKIENVTLEDLLSIGKKVTPKLIYLLKGAER